MVSLLSLKVCLSWQIYIPPFQQQTRKAVHYAALCSLGLVGPVIHSSWCDFLKADKAHETLPQTALFLWICHVNKERMDDDFKPHIDDHQLTLLLFWPYVWYITIGHDGDSENFLIAKMLHPLARYRKTITMYILCYGYVLHS